MEADCSHAVRLAEKGADIIAVDICRDVVGDNCSMATEADLEGAATLVSDPGALSCRLWPT